SAITGDPPGERAVRPGGQDVFWRCYGRQGPRSAAAGKPHVRPVEGVRQERPREQRESLPAEGPAEVLGELRQGAPLVQALEEDPRLEAAVREVVRRREDEHGVQLRRPPS